MTIKPTDASERGNGKMTIRVVGDDVDACLAAHRANEVIALDEPPGTYWRIVGSSTHGSPLVGFFDVEAVEAPAPATEDVVTEPGARRRLPRPPTT